MWAAQIYRDGAWVTVSEWNSRRAAQTAAAAASGTGWFRIIRL